MNIFKEPRGAQTFDISKYTARAISKHLNSDSKKMTKFDVKFYCFVKNMAQMAYRLILVLSSVKNLEIVQS